MPATVFKDVDIMDTLGQIMELHTRHYKEDFELDKKLILTFALSERAEDKNLLWMSRPCGTYTFQERDVYLKDSYGNNVWQFYYEQTKDPILAYAISLENRRDDRVIGNIYPLDYAKHVEQVKRLALPIENVEVTFEDGFVTTMPYQTRRRQIDMLMTEHGSPEHMRYEPASEQELIAVLRHERHKRSEYAVPGDIKDYISSLREGTVWGRLRKAQAEIRPKQNSCQKKEPQR